ncbi:MAG: aminoglycoside phosphotransferase family protein [Ruthenibacterium sp.]
MALQPAENLLQEALTGFDFGGDIVGALRFGAGHINDTFCVYTQQPSGDCLRFILQRINTDTFKDPVGLMENIVGVTDYLRDAVTANGGDPARETMTVLRTKENKHFYTDSTGGAWRVYPFVEDTLCLQAAETPELFYASGKAFGKFQQLLADYPADTLHETIVQFHDTENRLANFKKALAADSEGRAKLVQAEIEFVLAHEKDCSVAMQALRDKVLPLRVTHNDTKLNNILIDKVSHQGICVIDLDTVMPGLSINDFGDSIRFGANHSAEDEPDLSKVNFDLPLFDIYTKGYFEGAGTALTAAEKEFMPWGAKLMTLECGMRFLTDYLEGDHYFKVHRDGQNLDRCRTQFKLVRDMEAHWNELEAIVKKYS